MKKGLIILAILLLVYLLYKRKKTAAPYVPDFNQGVVLTGPHGQTVVVTNPPSGGTLPGNIGSTGGTLGGGGIVINPDGTIG